MDSAPLFAAREARVAIDGAVAIDALTLESKGDRLLFAGDVGALLSVLTGVPRAATTGARALDDGDAPPLGEALVVSGSLLLAGKNVGAGEHVATTGSAPLDPPLPAGWSALEYVSWSARLAGITRSAAARLALTALDRVGLGASAKKAATALALPERRALQLASAIVASPEVIIAEAPLGGLDGPAAAFVLRAVASATDGRRAVLSAARLEPGTPEGALCLGASHVVVLAGGEVALEGTPAKLFGAARLYALTVHSNADRFREELGAAGIALRGGPRRFSVALPEGASTRQILVAAKAARAAVVELVPIL